MLPPFQRKLPHESIYLDVPTTEAAWHAIKDMVVRRAPAIAIAAALALAVEVHQHSVFESADAAVKHITDRLDYLVSSRPTAVNLSDAAEKLKRVAEEAAKEEPTPEAVVLATVLAADAMLGDDGALLFDLTLHLPAVCQPPLWANQPPGPTTPHSQATVLAAEAMLSDDVAVLVVLTHFQPNISMPSANQPPLRPPFPPPPQATVLAAEAMLSDDVAGNKRIGAFGAQAVVEALTQKGVEGKNLRVLTHCNTGSLATAAYGTALGVIRSLHAQGLLETRPPQPALDADGHSIFPFPCFLLATAAYGTALGVIRSLHAQGLLETAVCTETRPYNQGSRLTAFELTHDGIPALLIADSAAASLKAAGRIDAVVVGADRIAANGDTANKIGTYSLALSAFHHKTPFFVAAPLSSIDAAIKTGEEIVVEERHANELTHSLGGAGPHVRYWTGEEIVVEERHANELTHSLGGAGPQVAPHGIDVWNPAFDITPAQFITGLITDKGVIWKKEGASVFDIRGFLHSLGAPVPSSPMYPPPPSTNTHSKEDDAQPHTDPHKDRIRFLHSLGAPVPSSPIYPPPASNNPHPKEDDAQPHTDPHKDRIRKDALEASRFTPVSEHTVPAFLQDHPDLAARLGGGPAEWSVREVGDGNINFVYIVEGPGGALVVKQALPYVRVVGESWPMTLDRIYYEALALRQQFAWVPELVPEVFFFSHPMALLVMRYVAPPAIVLRKGLVQGRVYPLLAEHMSSFLASTLFLSSLIAINTEVYRDKVREFCGNVEMCRLTEQVIFTEPYVLATNNRWTTPQLDADAAALREDVPLKLAITELKNKFCERAQALLHADLHTGSVMVTEESTVVIDPEFAFYGPMGFDIGAFLGNLLLAYFSQDGHATTDDSRAAAKWVLQCFVDTWQQFEAKFLALWNDKALAKGDAYPQALYHDNAALLSAAQTAFLREVFLDSLGFAGAKMIRRIVGIAHVEDLESIADPDVRAACERRALNFGKQLVKERQQFKSIADVAAAVEAIV
ncbi:unnamed protein product [Closterium sp. Naga37s-1]|nr:unnamed protein product [Closterium sp. Naga37s-1]